MLSGSVFTVRQHAAIAPGSLGLNAVQRKVNCRESLSFQKKPKQRACIKLHCRQLVQAALQSQAPRGRASPCL